MKILIIHASAGAGHAKAAEAIYNELKDSSSDDVTLVDVLDLTNSFYRSLYRGTYTFLVSNVPWLWGFVFAALDIQMFQGLIRWFRRGYNAFNAGTVHEFLKKENFDVIISTHFMPNEIAAALKRANKINSKIITVVTDFDVHKIWMADGIDTYAVASEWTKNKLNQLGIESNRVHFTGIPTDKKFQNTESKAALQKKLGLQENLFTVLIATGSFGIGPIEPIAAELKDFQVLVVCGHNKSLYERLSPKQTDKLKVYGLVDNMYELMAVADAMVTKPGGLSISEALVSGLPMIFFNAIPGQETNNIKVLKKHEVGISDCSIEEIVEKLNEYKSDPELYRSVQKKIEAVACPTAVKNITSLIS